jgi:hypothetical protein
LSPSPFTDSRASGSYGGGFIPSTPHPRPSTASTSTSASASTGSSGSGASAAGNAGTASSGISAALAAVSAAAASGAAAGASQPSSVHGLHQTSIFPRVTPRMFIQDHSDEYSEVAESYSRLLSEFRPLEERAAALTKFYNGRHNNATKETLYLLTVLMASIAPIQIGTGIYGMNFNNMPELRSPNGYYYFLTVVGVWLLLCAIWFARKKKYL